MTHTVSLTVRLADTLLARYPDPDTFPFRVWCYSQGYVLIGMLKAWRATGDERYFAWVRRFADQHVTPAGDLLGYSGDSLDDIMSGAVIAEMAAITGEERYRTAARTIYASMAGYPRNTDGGFWHGRRLPGQMWIDGVFMGGMFLIRYGRIVGQQDAGTQDACFSEMAAQIVTFADLCRKPGTGLFLHGYDESRKASWSDPTTGLSSEVWSEGLGWYALILVEALERWPEGHPGRGPVQGVLEELLGGLLRAQAPASGLWFQVVDKGHLPDNWCDTSGSAMFVYTLRRASELGIGDGAACAAAAQRGYAGLETRIATGADGGVDVLIACDGLGVQDSYRAYIDFPQKMNAKEAVGGVLWAATIMDGANKQG
ncbi:MAG: glycoside hydrolase family 88/105 protein [Anaerolineae bacterium]